MESQIVTTFLLVFYLLHDCSANESVKETILIDNKVSIKNGELGRESVSQETRPRKSFNIEIETSWGNRTVIGSLRDCVSRKKSSSLEEIRIFRYCSQNGPLHDRGKNPILRVNLIRTSTTEYLEKTTENFIRETESINALKNKTKATEGKENVFTENCRIHLDPNCDTAENNENFNYREWFLHPAAINHYDSDTNFTHDKEIIREINSSGHEIISFDVNKSTIGIYILVEGDFSNVSIEIPIDTKQESTGPTTLSMAQRENAQGVEIVALNAPPGGWRLKLTGEGASKYSFLAAAKEIRKKRDRSNPKYELLDVTTMPRDSESLIEENHTNYNASYKKNLRNLDNIEIFDESMQDNRRIFTSDDSLEDSGIRNERNKTELHVENLSPPFSSIQSEEQSEKEKIQSRLSNDPPSKIVFENNDAQTNMSISRMMENVNNQELTEEFARIGNDEKEEKRRIVVELNENSNLFVRPGTIHRIIFDVTNNHYQTIGCYFKVRSLPLAVYNVQPLYTWIFAGRTVNVFVDVEVPRRTNEDVINTLTLYVQGSEIIEKSVYLYVEGTIPNVVDDAKPSIEYTFNNNCMGKLSKDRCMKSRWSVDIRVQDSGSGLKSVRASPNELYPSTEFISGTRNLVTFYYSATCCSTQAKITATDLRNNVNTYTIDVTAWDNLSEAEIAAIVVGALLILLLIILIIILIVYCVTKRKSHDLPYTQRYGSRPPARAERTSF
ncbi:hypothetical protein KPH14_001466 [Odynerus spinipes]|uniref:Uncharacterized protein n=1 Tax=Odynerus spinipes TaxID=1348599 RepID=A0AAD9VTJ8_9HYME|nr:hypothetical protein KPH14_001466 [Odynerus spinipes]